MRVVVTGATGNVGTSLLDSLTADSAVDTIVGLARRVPTARGPAEQRWGRRVEWVAADVVTTELAPILAGADAVVHLAWLIQPSRRPEVLRATNVVGSDRVFAAAAQAGVRTLVYASSIGAYSPGPKDEAVDESWPTGGIDTSFYARHKSAVERSLDSFEAAHPDIRVVRLRPALIFKREAASGIRRLFLGHLVPPRILRPSLIPVVPRTERLVFQAVHTSDVAEAYRLALLRDDARGAFNLAADPVLDGEQLAEVLRARAVPVPAAVLRLGAQASWRLHLQPTPEGWIDMAVSVPVMDTSRARRELEWSPRVSAGDALLDLRDGFAHRAEAPTPALARRAPAVRDDEDREAMAVGDSA
ncbi:MAG: NAD-dependent epimerase/dehydratase family protein [Actinomycetota bacterium]|nr:NAD-dependent epimerase/dehydratase family protein [Actinomycetota bacterium]